MYVCMYVCMYSTVYVKDRKDIQVEDDEEKIAEHRGPTSLSSVLNGQLTREKYHIHISVYDRL